MNITYDVPGTVPLSDCGAVYLVKHRFELDVFNRDLNDAERQQTNQGGSGPTGR